MNFKYLSKEIQRGNQALFENRLIDAEQIYRAVIQHAPDIPEAHNNLGTVLKEQGRIGEARVCFERAVRLRSSYASAHSNLLFTLHYVPKQTLMGLRTVHEEWSKVQLAELKPYSREFINRESAKDFLTIGLVSPDLYCHPVGVFLLPWLLHRDRQRFRLVVYADCAREDGVMMRIRANVDDWRSIQNLEDGGVYEQIRQDDVDVLLDLAGHTAGNRLKLFARRAAPVQVSWLGYPSTTGVPTMDYVLMDDYSVPGGCEAAFTERVIRLEGSRFCYSPPDYAPAVAVSPVFHRDFITFGSFNNLAKVTSEVIETWSSILLQLPTARLVLKWKSLQDEETCERIRKQFSRYGIAPDRLECRGWSGHRAMLGEYGDIDIALDPFPFSGGLTSCDALYMGVPVLTWPGELPISRQTASFLNTMGLHDWIAADREDYIARALRWAANPLALGELRAGLRERMLASKLCDGFAYARSVEKALLSAVAAHKDECHQNIQQDFSMKTFLHIGCGPKYKDQTTRGFNTAEWRELRFDIDESVNPDFVGTMTDMAQVAAESVDAIFSSHNIEHLYPHEVPVAFAEFLRVLKPDGFFVVTCPDLKSVCQLVAEDKLTEAAYTAPAGPIAPLDILYGHRPAMARGNLYMAHRCGFTQKVLDGTLRASGFQAVASLCRGRAPFFDLWAVASKSPRSEAEIREIALAHFPQ